jgi:hypothetical protein
MPPSPDAAEAGAGASDSGGEAPADSGFAPEAGAELVALAEERCSGPPPACGDAALRTLTLSSASVTGLGADGVLSGGELASVSVTLTNEGAAPSAHCMALIAGAGILVDSSQNGDGMAWACQFGDIEPGSSAVFTWQVRSSENAAPGLVRVLAYVTQGQSDCPCSQSPRLELQIVVG